MNGSTNYHKYYPHISVDERNMNLFMDIYGSIHGNSC